MRLSLTPGQHSHDDADHHTMGMTLGTSRQQLKTFRTEYDGYIGYVANIHLEELANNS